VQWCKEVRSAASVAAVPTLIATLLLCPIVASDKPLFRFDLIGTQHF